MDDKKRNKPEARVTLKMVADQLGFTPGTISAVLSPQQYAGVAADFSTHQRPHPGCRL